MNHDPDDSPDDLETRLRAWRPAAVPHALHARLLAAEPPPRRPAMPARRTLLAAGALALLAGWWLGGVTNPSAGLSPDRSTARRAPQAGQGLDVAWVPGASLTMNLATGAPAGNPPAPWRLDGDPGVETDLFAVPSIDGKMLLKVDCQF